MKRKRSPFAKCVMRHLIDADMTINDLAKAIGYNQTHLSACLSGMKPVSDELQRILIKYFKIKREEWWI